MYNKSPGQPDTQQPQDQPQSPPNEIPQREHPSPNPLNPTDPTNPKDNPTT